MPPNTPNGYPMMPSPYQGRPARRMNGLLIPFVITVLLLLVAGGGFAWAYVQMLDYKNNADKIADRKVEISKQQITTELEKQFLEREKSPFKSYRGPAEYGSVAMQYPKSWSAYIAEAKSGSNPVDGYFYPDIVPGLQSGKQYALRVQVTTQAYDNEMRQFTSKAQSGKVRVSPYRAAKVPGTLGSRVEGEINTGQKNVMIVLPLRTNTLKIWSETDVHFADLEKVLESLQFEP